MANKFLYIQTSDPKQIVQVILHEENEYDAMNSVRLVDADTVPGHAFNLVTCLKREWLQHARDEAKSAGLKLRRPQTCAIR